MFHSTNKIIFNRDFISQTAMEPEQRQQHLYTNSFMPYFLSLPDMIGQFYMKPGKKQSK
jgi:hypothetical protein